MHNETYEKIRANPKYHELKNKRNSFGWLLTVITLIVYYGYILLIAFNKEFLAQKLGTGVTSVGIPIGLGVILFTVLHFTDGGTRMERVYSSHPVEYPVLPT